MLEYCVPKYAIQTLVEKAVLHGIDPMGGEGRISVKGEKEGKDLCIRVTDNGVGIPEGKLKKIRDRLASARETSDEEGIGDVYKRQGVHIVIYSLFIVLPVL